MTCNNHRWQSPALSKTEPCGCTVTGTICHACGQVYAHIEPHPDCKLIHAEVQVEVLDRRAYGNPN